MIFGFIFFLLSISALASELDGTWEQACLQGYQRVITFSERETTLLEKNFLDSNCGSLRLITKSEGTSQWEESNGLRSIDFTFRKVTITVIDPFTAHLFRSAKVCGISDWETFREIEISGFSCDFDSTGWPLRVPSPQEIRYGIFLLENEQLRFGLLQPHRDGTSPERRPALLQKEPFARVSR